MKVGKPIEEPIIYIFQKRKIYKAKNFRAKPSQKENRRTAAEKAGHVHGIEKPSVRQNIYPFGKKPA